MQACECPEKFDKILVAAVATLTTMYCLYGTLCYAAWGALQKQMVSQMLPQGDMIVKILLLLMVLQVICSYPLCIFPANSTIERVTINKMLAGNKSAKTVGQNVSRVLVCIAAAYIGIELSNSMDKILALVGALFCAPLALFIPTLCHLVKLANTRAEKIGDIVILIISLVILVFCVSNAIV